MEADMEKAPESTLWDIVEDVTFCMFVTRDGECLRSRPMTLKSDAVSGEFQFLAARTSETAEEIRRNPSVNLAFAEPKERDYVSVSGQATVGQDRALIAELWSPYAQKFFGGSPDSADVVVIHVVPERAEYWDGETQAAKGVWKVLKGAGSRGETRTAKNEKVTF